jgi:hypothetical protein
VRRRGQDRTRSRPPLPATGGGRVTKSLRSARFN